MMSAYSSDHVDLIVMDKPLYIAVLGHVWKTTIQSSKFDITKCKNDPRRGLNINEGRKGIAKIVTSLWDCFWASLSSHVRRLHI